MTGGSDAVKKKWDGWISVLLFFIVFAGHAGFIRYQTSSPSDGWADVGLGSGAMWGFGSYVQAGDYYLSFSYALGAAFTIWAILKYRRVRNAAMAAGAAGGVTLVGALMGLGCFMIGCCGSPMLGVYAGIFGAKALGVGKPLMAVVTMLSVSGGYFFLSRRLARNSQSDVTCNCNRVDRS